MRLVVKKAERLHLLNCCHRQPFVGAAIDFEDELEPCFSVSCPVCGRSFHGSSFVEARDAWNDNLVQQSWIRR